MANFVQRMGQKATGLLTDPNSRIKDHHPAAPSIAESRADGGKVDIAQLIARDVQTVISQHRAQAEEAIVHFLSLSKLRERPGPKWEKTAAWIDGMARQEIERRLVRADVFKCMDGLNYLVLFARLSLRQAQLKCALIAEDIARRLRGAAMDASALEVKTAMLQPDGSVVLVDVPAVADLADAILETRAEAGSAETATEVAPADAELDVSSSFVGIRFVYRPMWDVQRNALATYICVPAVDDGEGTTIAGEAAVRDIGHPDMAFELDKRVLTRVIDDLKILEAVGRKLLLIAPVHFETIANRRRRDVYLRLCKAISPACVKLVIFELIGVPEQIPPGRLFELTCHFRNVSRAVILRTPVTRSQIYFPYETGIFAVGADLSGSDRGEAELMRDMERLAGATAKAGLRSYIHGLGSVSLTTAAVGAGFDYIDGDMITNVVDAPRSAYRFEARNIYANPFLGSGTAADGP
jgi:hypothetical protein